MSEDQKDQEGRIIAERYRITRLLGQGGMGSVWRAEHLTLGSEVAIKLIDPAVANNPEIRARFVREAKAAASLRSPHVVQIIDYGVDDDTPYIAMELMEGETLAERLDRDQKLSPADTSRLITEVARALTKAHDAGIVHRDLKPDNIFLVSNDDTEVAKVLDFGVAKQTLGTENAHMTSTGAVMGTPYYMSPEQAEGSKSLDHRTDIWALSVIAYECLLGARPFDAETLGGLFLAICTRDKPVPSGVSAVPLGYDAWFHQGTARNVDERFATAREAARTLREICLEEERPSALPGNAQAKTIAVPTKRAGSKESSTRLSEGTPSTAELGETTIPPDSAHSAAPHSATPHSAAPDPSDLSSRKNNLDLSTVAGGAIAVPMEGQNSSTPFLVGGFLAVVGLAFWFTLGASEDQSTSDVAALEDATATSPTEAAQEALEEVPRAKPIETPEAARPAAESEVKIAAEPPPRMKKPEPKRVRNPSGVQKAVDAPPSTPAQPTPPPTAQPTPPPAVQPTPTPRPRPRPRPPAPKPSPTARPNVDLGI